MSTSGLLAAGPLNPRALMAHWRESICATCRFAARRSASARLEAPERRMSSWVITWIAEAVCDKRSGRFDTEVTCRFINCSMLNFFRASADRLESGRWPAESGCCANPGRTKHTRPNVKTSDVAAAPVLIPAIGRYPLVYVYGGRELFPHNMPFWHSAVVTHVAFPAPGLHDMAAHTGGARASWRDGPAMSGHAAA